MVFDDVYYLHMMGERYFPRPTMQGGLRALGLSVAVTVALGGAAIVHRLASGDSDTSVSPAPITGEPRASVLDNPARSVIHLSVTDKCFTPPGGRRGQPFPTVELRPDAPILIAQTLVTRVTDNGTGISYTDAVSSHTAGIPITPDEPYRMSSVADSTVPRTPFQAGSVYGFEIHDAGVDAQINEATLRAAGTSNPIAPCDV